MRVAFFYFVFISISGLVVPFFPKYLDALGFSGTQIARINSVGPILLMFVPLAWGFVADKTGRTLLLVKIACTGVMFALVGLALGGMATFGTVLAIWLVYGFFQSPLLPLTDSLAIVEARRIGTDYARLRLWGSVSYILVSFVYGYFLDAKGDIRRLPTIAACLAVLSAVCVHLLQQHGDVLKRTPPSLKDARKLFHDAGLMWFLIAGMVHQAALSPYYLFYSIHIDRLGLPQSIVSWSSVLGVGAEITMFWFARPLFRRKPLFALMAFSYVLSTGRWLLVAAITNGPLMALLQICHAFTFALCYAGAIMHLEKNVAETLRSTGRALFAAISMGLGSVLGHSLAGWIADNHNTGATFQIAAALDVVALVPLMFATKYSTQPKVITAHSPREEATEETPTAIAE